MGELVVRFFGSNNSRYFAVKLPGEVRLYRGITAGDGLQLPNEAGFLWSRQVDDNIHGSILRIGNQGDLFFMSPRGLFRMRLDRNATLDQIAPVCQVARSEEPNQLGRVCVDADGREVFFETITPEAGLKGKLFRLLGSKGQANPSAIVHQIHPYSISTNQQDLPYPGGVLDAKKGGEFLWNASPCFRYLVMARPEKKTYNIQVVDVAEKSYIDFSMPLATLAGVWVNEYGTVMVDVRQIGSEQLVIGRREGDRFKRYGFEPPPSYEVAHLAKSYVALKVRTPPRLCLFNFEGSIQADVDVRPLQSMGVTFDFSFNERDDIDVLTWHQGSLFVHHSDSKSIVFDAKRWELTARHAQYEIEEQMVQEATSAHQEEVRRLDRLDATQRLAASVMAEMQAIPDSSLHYEEAVAPPLPPPEPPRAPMVRQLEIEEPTPPPSRPVAPAGLPAINKRPAGSLEIPVRPSSEAQTPRLNKVSPPPPTPPPAGLHRPSGPPAQNRVPSEEPRPSWEPAAPERPAPPPPPPPPPTVVLEDFVPPRPP